MKEYFITELLRNIEEKAKKLGYHSDYDEGFNDGESDRLILSSDIVGMKIKDCNNPRVVRPFYVHIYFNHYDYIGMYNMTEMEEMLKACKEDPKRYISENFEK